MLGKRFPDQKGLWEAKDRLYLDYVGKDSCLRLAGLVAGPAAWGDDDFAEKSDCPDNGRDSVPPSLLTTPRCCCRPTTR